MARTVYEMRDEILALSPSVRANLLAAVEQKEVTAPYEASRADTEIWQALVRLCPMGMRHRVLDEFLRDRKEGMARREWAEAVETIGSYTAQAMAVRRRDEDRAALVDLLLDCLAADMRARGDAVTPKTIMQSLPRLHGAVDRAFPGYIEAGLLHKLIRRATIQEPIE